MHDEKDDRARRLAVYMIESSGTVRSAAAKFGISKSTVHKDLCELLPRASPVLWTETNRNGTSGEAWPPGRSTDPKISRKAGNNMRNA